MKKSQKTQKRTKWLFIILILTAVLSITATYAWFSTQRDIDITGMRLNVEVAESMQISLDGEIWTQSIQIADMRQFYGTYTGTGDSFAIYQAKKPDNGGNQNYVPTELKPVSTVGTVTGGKLQFVKGTIGTTAAGKTELTAVTACSEADLTDTATIANRQNGNESHPFLVFDMYLRNVSAKADGQLDILELNAGSNVWVNTGTSDDTEQEGAGKADTGLEYSARVGMIVYGNTVGIAETDDPSGTEGAKTIGQKIRGLTSAEGDKAAIWEPNDKNHTTYVVNNNGRGIDSIEEAVVTYGVKETVATSENKTVPDINDTTDETNLAAVTTMKPAYTLGAGTDSKVNITDTAGTDVGLKPNTISKVRVYVWLEGQDPDCVDLASTGDKLNVTLKLTKDQTTSTDNNSYVGKGTNTPTQVGEIITANEVMTSDYGATVTNYALEDSAAQKSVNWRIFHSDGENIYLIADDYVETQYIPAGKGGNKINTSTTDSYAQGFDFGSITNDYAGWADLSNSSIATKWLSKYAASTYTSTNANMKATAYLLDTSVWNPVFVNSNYAEYAIGGPTLELFTASYNVTHTDKTIDTQVSSKAGYKVKWSTDTSYADYINGLNTSEDLYIISDNTNAYAMWVASPSALNFTDDAVLRARPLWLCGC